MITESTVILLAFFIVMLLFSKPIYKVLYSKINDYRIGIKQRVQDSLQEREESMLRLSTAIKQNESIEEKVAQILSNARLEAKLIATNESKILNESMQKKVQEAKAKLSNEKLLAIEELKESVINISTHYAYKLITLKLNDRVTQEKIINFAIEKIPNKIH